MLKKQLDYFVDLEEEKNNFYRYRKMLKNEYSLATIGADTAENGSNL